jgi:hypothetical protein
MSKTKKTAAKTPEVAAKTKKTATKKKPAAVKKTETVADDVKVVEEVEVKVVKKRAASKKPAVKKEEISDSPTEVSENGALADVLDVNNATEELSDTAITGTVNAQEETLKEAFENIYSENDVLYSHINAMEKLFLNPKGLKPTKKSIKDAIDVSNYSFSVEINEKTGDSSKVYLTIEHSGETFRVPKNDKQYIDIAG